MTSIEGLPRGWLDRFLDMALEEDLGNLGDITSAVTLPADRTGVLRLELREPGVLAGAALLPALLAKVDPELELSEARADGSRLKAMEVFARARGPLRSLLTMERTALNLVGKLSGIATHTRRFVDAAGGQVKVADTRKTTPLLRPLEKYAVRMGGGVNHRHGLYDAAMIKDNHRAGSQGGGGNDLEAVVRQARDRLSHAHRLIVEVESEEGAAAAVAGGADVLLLDNMDPPRLARLAERYRDRVLLEASGGITLDTLAAFADTGVHLVSTSALVTRARWLDVGAELEGEA